MKKVKKICLVSSPGGHLYKILLLKNWWQKHQHFWVTEKTTIDLNPKIFKLPKTYLGYFPENRNLINFFKNLVLAFKVLSKEKPDLLFSTGAGIAPPFFLVAKLLKIKTVFLETFVFINKPTLSGKLIYFFKLADTFLVQNQTLLKIYPKAKYQGSVL